MTEEWANMLNGISFSSRQKGRMSHLLKKKSKEVKKQKKRKTYEPFNFMKRFRNQDGKVIDVPMSQIDTGDPKDANQIKKIIPIVIKKSENKK